MSELWTAFHFLRPQWLWFLLAVPLIYLSFRIRDDVRSRWKRYIDPELLDHLIVSRKKLWRSRNPGFWKRYRRTIMLAVLSFLAALIVVWLGWYFLPKIYRRLQVLRERRSRSEVTYFRQFRRSCIHNDSTQSYVWLLKWLEVRHPRTSLQLLLESANDPALSSAVNDLAGALFAKNIAHRQWSGKELAKILSNYRKTYNAALSEHTSPLDLNPTAPIGVAE
jgi:hypothetical protein